MFAITVSLKLMGNTAKICFPIFSNRAPIKSKKKTNLVRNNSTESLNDIRYQHMFSVHICNFKLKCTCKTKEHVGTEFKKKQTYFTKFFLKNII